jgi:hypothetical protein
VKNLLMRLSTLDMLRRLLFELGLLFENSMLNVFGLFGVFFVWSFSVPNTVEVACVLLKYSMEAC